MKLTMVDRELLSVLRLTGRGNPEIALKIADLSPALRDQIRAAGGLNTFVNPDAGKPLFARRSVRRYLPEELQAKANEAKDLAEIARLVGDVCDEAPAKAEQVFAGALRRVLAETDGKKAGDDFCFIGRQCTSYLGELPVSWVQAGTKPARQSRAGFPRAKPKGRVTWRVVPKRSRDRDRKSLLEWRSLRVEAISDRPKSSCGFPGGNGGGQRVRR